MLLFSENFTYIIEASVLNLAFNIVSISIVNVERLLVYICQANLGKPVLVSINSSATFTNVQFF